LQFVVSLTTAEVSALAARLRLSALRLARRLRQQARADVTPSGHSALAVIERFGPLTLGDLAALERISAPSMTRIVARLEQEGYLAREPDERDRRVARVALSPRGKELMRRSRSRKDLYLVRRLNGLSRAQLETLEAAVEVIELILDEEND
jgi:DNA-binding MarR family transcriptional regulator